MVRSLKYMSNFWQSFELKLKWMKHCTLSVVHNNNADANLNNVTCTIKDTISKTSSMSLQSLS